MTSIKPISHPILFACFFFFLGVFFSQNAVNFVSKTLSIVSVFTLQYCVINGLIFVALRLWWSERWMDFYERTIQSNKKRISQMTAGWGFWVISNWWIDNPVYLFVIASQGLVVGGIIMAVFAIFWNSAYVLFHEYHKRNGVDWLGLDGLDSMRQELEEKMHQLKTSQSNLIKKVLLFIPRMLIKAVLWMLKKGDKFAFLALTIWTDSFVTLAYVRRGRTGKITGRDWGLFLLSSIISNAYWSVRSYGIVFLIRFFIDIF